MSKKLTKKQARKLIQRALYDGIVPFDVIVDIAREEARKAVLEYNAQFAVKDAD